MGSPLKRAGGVAGVGNPHLKVGANDSRNAAKAAWGTKADPPYRRMGKALGAGRDVVI